MHQNPHEDGVDDEGQRSHHAELHKFFDEQVPQRVGAFHDAIHVGFSVSVARGSHVRTGSCTLMGDPQQYMIDPHIEVQPTPK
ncbi:hypothetical protein GCM10025781_13310 [Kocuria gwangalliensis]|uniref:Uncharacterized protein n=1 Tax=Kocuria gwangalliensis TaxID=501592 RepID=A0ABP8WYD8_9MICC